MNQSRTIIGVAHDPGGARAILPVLAFLHQRGGGVSAICSGPAVEISEREFPEIPLKVMEDLASHEDCVEVLASHECRALVSAAGLYNTIEHTMRLAARAQGVPVVAVLDWWSMPRERLQRRFPDGRIVTSFPDRICALDETSRAELMEEGFTAPQIVVTGAANLESSWKRLGRYTPQVGKLREEIGIRAGEKCAVFFSEPYIRASDGLPWKGLGGNHHQDCTPVYGYTAHGMLAETAAALASQKPAHQDLVLCVKPHPMEDVPSLVAAMGQCESKGIRMVLVDRIDPLWLCATGDIFFGMVSIILMEAALTRRPVLSVQIGFEGGMACDPCMSNRLGFTRPVYDRTALRQHVAQWFEGSLPGTGKDVSLAFEGAAGRIAQTIAKSLG